MLNHEQLKQTLKNLDDTPFWFFICLNSHPCPRLLRAWNFTDLLKLPKRCHQNLMEFFSVYDNSTNEKNISIMYGGNMSEFIRDATGLEWELFLKILDIQKRVEEAKEDFIPISKGENDD